MVLVGAGISTSVGIPDFRSKDSGLYAQLAAASASSSSFAAALACPEDLFDLEFFHDNPVPFYTFASQHLAYYYHGINLNTTESIRNNTSNNNGTSNSTTTSTSTTTRKKSKRKRNVVHEEDYDKNTNMQTSSSGTASSSNSSSTSSAATTTSRIRPSDSHKLLALLEQQNRLLRVYTQNIDGLEHAAGVSASKIVYCHGSLHYGTCITCSQKFALTTTTTETTARDTDDTRQNRQQFIAAVRQGTVPYCQVRKKTKQKKNKYKRKTKPGHPPGGVPSITLPQEQQQEQQQQSRRSSGRRTNTARRYNSDTSSRGSSPYNSTTTDITTTTTNQDEEDDKYCGGILKPGITFFGEPLSNHVTRCIEKDGTKVDAIIVIGTSLSVAPISQVIQYLQHSSASSSSSSSSSSRNSNSNSHNNNGIPTILINRTMVHLPTNKNKKQNKKKRNTTTSSSTTNNNSKKEEEEENGDDTCNRSVFDSYLLGNCDDITRAIVKSIQTKEELEGSCGRKNKNTKNCKQPFVSDISSSARLLTTVLREEKDKSKKENSTGGCYPRKKQTSSVRKDDDAKDGDGDNNRDTTNTIDFDGNTRGAAIEKMMVPPDRVILFPGGVVTSLFPPSSSSSFLDNTENTDEYHEVVQCDGCSQQIRITTNTNANTNTNTSTSTINGREDDNSSVDNVNTLIYKCTVCFDYDLCSECYPKQSKTHFNGRHVFTSSN